MFIYIYIMAYYKLYLYFNKCLGVILGGLSCSFTSTLGPSWSWSDGSWFTTRCAIGVYHY